MFCSKCGVQLPDDSKFCKECGAQILHKEESLKGEELNTPVNESLHNTDLNTPAETIKETYSQNAADKKPDSDAVQTQSAPALQTITPEADVKQEVQQTAVTAKKSGKVKMTVLSTLLFLMILITSFMTVLVFSVREGLDSDNTDRMISDIDIQALLESDELGLMENFNEEIFNEKDLVRIYEKSDIDDFLKDIAEDFSEYLTDGEEPVTIDSDEIIRLVQKNEDVVYDVAEYEITESNYERIQEYFDGDGKEIFENLEKSPAMTAARVILSKYVAWGLALLTLLLFAVLLVVRRGSISAFLWCSIAFIMSALALVIVNTKGIVLGIVSNDLKLVREFVSLYLEKSFLSTFLISGALILTSIVMIVVYVSVNNIKKKMQQRKNVIN